ncbi:hypothetical protein [Streptosporangium vulgare]|uniref:DUF3108 domain-containing protein n=1 Tax=Streptosporangium vulgare TaxID=46190 RepID=A0ABV5TMP1_9ACTN
MAKDDLMRRLSALLGTLALLFTPSLSGTAHAQSHDSLTQAISALKGEFTKKSSVFFSRKTYDGFGSDVVALTVAHGKHRFAAKVGVYASDVTEAFSTGDRPVHFRIINVGRDSYTQGTWADVPEGKKWLHSHNTEGFLWSQNLVDALNPRFLQLISSGAERTSVRDRYDGVPTIRYDGLVKIGSLGSRQAGIYYGPRDGRSVGGRIKWKLWLGPDNLPRRFQIEIVSDPYGPEREVDIVRTNTLYKGWGTPVHIAAPPKNLVAEDD